MNISIVDTHPTVLRVTVKNEPRFEGILDSMNSQIKLEGVIPTSGIPQCKGLF
jgi:hypothetical protein